MRARHTLRAALLVPLALLVQTGLGRAQDAAPTAPEPATAPAAEPPASEPTTASVPALVPSAPTPVASAPPPPAAASAEVSDDTRTLDPYARLMTGFAVDRFHPAGGQLPRDETEPGFFLKQARIGLDAKLDKRVSASLSFDLDAAAVRNAYLNVRLERKALQVRAGHFKRPFSRLANRSVGAIPFRSRGLFDKLLLQDQQWGDRALGAMLFGRPVKALRYYAAVMSPATLGSKVEGADLIGRAEWDPTAWLSIGAAGAHKWTERFADGPNLSLHALTFDAKLETGGLYVAAELDAAQNPNPPPIGSSTAAREPWAIGVLGYGVYTFKLGNKLGLGPVAVLEWMDPDTSYSLDQRMRGVLGLLISYRGAMLRLMPQVELTRPVEHASPRGEVASETYYLLVSTEF